MEKRIERAVYCRGQLRLAEDNAVATRCQAWCRGVWQRQRGVLCGGVMQRLCQAQLSAAGPGRGGARRGVAEAVPSAALSRRGSPEKRRDGRR